MAKTSMINRELKRAKMVEKYAKKRIALKKSAIDLSLTEEEREQARVQLQKLPRDASPVRMRNRCQVTGRPHGVYRKFGLARNKLREFTMFGFVPGLRKGSW